MRYSGKWLRERVALSHLPLVSKPNMSNRPCVATSIRLLRSFGCRRALRSARCGEDSAGLLEGEARASTFEMASARTINVSIPMRRRRRNIEEGGALVGQACVRASTLGPTRFGPKVRFKAQTRDYS